MYASKKYQTAVKSRQYAATTSNRSYSSPPERSDRNRDFPKQTPILKGSIAVQNLPDEELYRLSKMTSNQTHFSPQHEDNVKFVKEEWEQVKSALNRQKVDNNSTGVVRYNEASPYISPDFQPFDIEEYWGKKFLKSTGVDDNVSLKSS